MPLNVGDNEANSGMANAIYKVIDEELRPPIEEMIEEMEENGVSTDAIEQMIKQMQKKWRLLSYAIAAGVIAHLQRDPTTEPEYAEAFSSSEEDATFWSWLDRFIKVFKTWEPVTNNGGSSLKTDLTDFLNENPVPSSLKGVIK